VSASMQDFAGLSILDEYRSRHDSALNSRTIGIIVPTRNESVNVVRLIERLSPALAPLDCNWHVLFVDDSEDDTPTTVRRLARDGWPAKVIHRPQGFRTGGLSGAVVSGIVNCEADVLVVMDADLQHPPEVVADLVRPLLDGSIDITVATRYSGGGGGGGLDGAWRKLVSRASRHLTHAMFREVREISDPCGGFFAFKRSVVAGVYLQPGGFKILMEILVRGNWTSAHEVPYLFASRRYGESKTSFKEGIAFLGHMRRLRMTRSRGVPAVQGASSGDFDPAPRGDVVDITDHSTGGRTEASLEALDPDLLPATGTPFWLLVAALHLRPSLDKSIRAGSLH
jgi:glycosyltransferase involved in cell wall biosynthesis